MKNLIRKIKSLPFEFQQKFNSIYKQQSTYVANTNPPKNQKQLTYRHNTYPQLDKFFMKFANSRPVEGRVSGKSLAFVIGPENVGKTQYINKNLIQVNKKVQSARSVHFSQSKSIKFKNSTLQINCNKSPQYLQSEIMQSQFQSPYLLMIKKDYSKQGDLNFINFLQDLHESMFKQIVRVIVDFEKDQKSRNNNRGYNKLSGNKQKQKKQQQPHNILTSQIIKNIALSTYSAQYLYIYLKDVVFAIMQEKDLIRLSKQGLSLLQEFNSTYLEAGQCQVKNFLEQHFQQLINIIHSHKQNSLFISPSELKGKNPQIINQNIQKTITTLQLFYSIAQRMEYEHRPVEYEYAFYKSGIQTTDFLFQVTNFLTGVGKYVENVQKQFKALQQSEKQEWKQNLLQKNNFILNGGHVDSLLCMTNIDHLLCFNTRQPAFLNWIDHIILRTVQSAGFRHHFPIILEIPNRKFLDELLQLGKIQGSNPVIIQIPGYIQSFLKYSNLIELFDQKRAIKLFHTFGRNPHTWKNAIQNMAKGVDFDDITSGQALYQQKQKIIIESKLNRVYTDQGCIGIFNKGQLDFEIMEVIRLFGKVNGMGRAQMSFLGTVLFKQPYFQAMLQKNIFYHSYYLPYMDYSSNLPASLSCLQHIRKRLKKNNSYLGYMYWKYFVQEYRLSIRDLRYKQVHEKLMIQYNTWGRQHYDLQFETTYYGPLKSYSIQYMNATKKMEIGS